MALIDRNHEIYQTNFDWCLRYANELSKEIQEGTIDPIAAVNQLLGFVESTAEANNRIYEDAYTEFLSF